MTDIEKADDLRARLDPAIKRMKKNKNETISEDTKKKMEYIVLSDEILDRIGI